MLTEVQTQNDYDIHYNSDYFLIEEIFQLVIFKLHSSNFIKTPRLTLVPRYVPGAPGLVSEIHLAVRIWDELRRPKPGR